MTNVKVITPGQKYQLLNHENPQSTTPQNLRFINKEPAGEDNKELRTVYNGTTNEAVLEMMVHRLSVLYEKLPSPETKEAISHLEQAMDALNARTEKREEAGVEGTHQPVDGEDIGSKSIPEEMPWDSYLKKNGLETIAEVKSAYEGDGLAGLKYMNDQRAQDVASFLMEKYTT